MNELIRLLVILVFFVVAGVAAGITYKNKDFTFFGMFATFWVIFLLFTIYQISQKSLANCSSSSSQK